MRGDHLARIVWTAVNESLFYFPSGVRKIYPGLTFPQFLNSEPLSFVISFSFVFTVCGSDFTPYSLQCSYIDFSSVSYFGDFCLSVCFCFTIIDILFSLYVEGQNLWSCETMPRIIFFDTSTI